MNAVTRTQGKANALYELPKELFTNILSSFCDGKTISTFLLASQASREFDGFDTVQGALVQRYQQMTQTVQDENIGETLDMLLSQVQACERSSPECMKLFSEQCAILDYFEAHSGDHHWLIWSGRVDTFYGEIQAFLTSPYWSISAIASWYRDLEMTQFSLVRSRVDVDRPASHPFGTFAGRSQRDAALMDQLHTKLQINYNSSDEYWKGMLTALQFAYDGSPPLVLTTHAYPILANHQDTHVPSWLCPTSSLSCYWDDYDGYDDQALQNLGEHIIRLMEQFTTPRSSITHGELEGNSTCIFREAWQEAAIFGSQPRPEFFQDDNEEDVDTENENEVGEEVLHV